MIRFYDTNASYRFEIGTKWRWVQVDWWYDKFFRQIPSMPLEIRYYNARKGWEKLTKEIGQVRQWRGKR